MSMTEVKFNQSVSTPCSKMKGAGEEMLPRVSYIYSLCALTKQSSLSNSMDRNSDRELTPT